MNDFVETHRSFVNAWEMDENAHMNVQFYYKRFDEAARFFALLSAGAEQPEPTRDRHVRYHAELLVASTTRIRSAVIADGRHQGCIVHRLEHAETGALCATALDRPSGFGFAHSVAEADVLAALPRSLSAAPLKPLQPDEILEMGGLAANRSIVGSGECGADGRMREQSYIARFSDSAPHAWHRSGVDVEWLRAHGLGRVAVEMKLTRHAPSRVGDALTVFSAPSRASGKTVVLRHEIVRMSDKAAIASGEVVALILDHTSRKPRSLPDHVVERLNARSA